MTEPQYTTEQMLLTNSGLKVTMLYPEEIAEDAPLLGVVAPDISSKYEFKVRVSKAKGQWLWRVLLYERQGDLINYKVIEKYKAPNEKRAMRKANRLIRRGINMSGVK